MTDIPVIILRDCIARDADGWPKGIIMPWPADMPLIEGFIWLREQVFVSGPGGEAIPASGDITPEAQQVMREAAG
jgi:hypothetical protein